MGMDRVRERLADGQPPLRLGELAGLTGYSRRYLQKLMDAGLIDHVGLGEERRIPVQEALRMARDLRILVE